VKFMGIRITQLRPVGGSWRGDRRGGTADRHPGGSILASSDAHPYGLHLLRGATRGLARGGAACALAIPLWASSQP
jgi:hypothetical protein